jgi:hypothetical protein
VLSRKICLYTAQDAAPLTARMKVGEYSKYGDSWNRKTDIKKTVTLRLTEALQSRGK